MSFLTVFIPSLVLTTIIGAFLPLALASHPRVMGAVNILGDRAARAPRLAGGAATRRLRPVRAMVGDNVARQHAHGTHAPDSICRVNCAVELAQAKGHVGLPADHLRGL